MGARRSRSRSAPDRSPHTRARAKPGSRAAPTRQRRLARRLDVSADQDQNDALRPVARKFGYAIEMALKDFVKNHKCGLLDKCAIYSIHMIRCDRTFVVRRPLLFGNSMFTNPL